MVWPTAVQLPSPGRALETAGAAAQGGFNEKTKTLQEWSHEYEIGEHDRRKRSYKGSAAINSTAG